MYFPLVDYYLKIKVEFALNFGLDFYINCFNYDSLGYFKMNLGF